MHLFVFLGRMTGASSNEVHTPCPAPPFPCQLRRSNSVKIIFGEPLILLLFFGGMVRFMAGYSIGSYLPDFYSQIYPDYNTICEFNFGSGWFWVVR